LDADQVDRLFHESIVIDGSVAPHVDDAYVASLMDSGVTAINWTVCTPFPGIGLATTLAEIAAGLEFVDAHAEHLVLVRTAQDIQRAKREGKVAVIFGPQNAKPAEAGLFMLRTLWEMGVRILQLTYNERNLYGDGIAEPSNGGLSIAGRAVIAEMNRLGIVLDLSHCGDRTTLEAVDASAEPVLITHSNARTLHASPRNKTDEQIKAIAARGGVIGLSLWSPMLRFDRRPTLEDFARQVDYVANLVGIEHCAIGTDHSEGSSREAWVRRSGKGGAYPTVSGPMGDWFTFETRFPDGAMSVKDFRNVAGALAGLGLSASELSGVLGGNFLRLCESVWKT